jgi:hypothetical protein
MKTTLDDIVKSVLIHQEKYTTHEYMRLMHIAHQGLKQLTFDILMNKKVDLLEVSDSLRVDLPDDYVDYSFVGLIGSDGRIKPLGRRTDIPLVGTQNTVPSTQQDLGFVDGGLYGYGGGQNENGYYSPTIDHENNQMVLTSIAAGKYVYLEYIGDGSTATGDTVVHPYAEDALITYVHWKDVQFRRNVSMSEKEARRRDFYNEKRIARARLKAFTKEEALQQARKGFKQAPKL